jgi:low affinity Fe/Cu permease
MICVLLILVYTGTGDLHFSDTVLVTLLTTTTAQVLGFGVIVANYLYKQKKKKKALG